MTGVPRAARQGSAASAGVKMRLAFLLSSLLCLAACTSPAPRRLAEGAVRWQASPNFDARRPNFVVLHHTSNRTQHEALYTLTNPARKVSAHYLVGRGGEIVQLVEEKERAWHAGASWWGGNTDVNSISIGIELDNDGCEPFADAQIDALLSLLADVTGRNGIPGANVIGHADVAPGRKTDPSALFPWRRLAEYGFGLWCDDPPAAAPETFDPALGLAALGYSPARPETSRQAFLLHYAGGRENLSEAEEKALVWCILRKKQDTAR
jgi:N-acetylmuramoyl-L-alanine amidase